MISLLALLVPLAAVAQVGAPQEGGAEGGAQEGAARDGTEATPSEQPAHTDMDARGAPDAAPGDVTSADPLAIARAALEARDPGCDKRALEALQSGALDERAAGEAWSLRARCALVSGDAERATRAFAAALRIDPAIAAIDDESFVRARAERLPRSLAFEVTFDGAVLSFSLLGDDLQLARSAAIVGPEGERARVPLEVGHGVHRVSGVDPTGAEARLLDRWGNVIARAAIAAAEPAVGSHGSGGAGHAGEGGPGVLTYVGASLVGAGFIGLTAASVGTAVTGKDVLDDAPLWVAGLAAGGALFLAGAGLVVVDQGL